MTDVRTCLWFAKDGEAAARFYTSLLPDAGIDHVMRAPGPYPSGEPGNVLLIDFHLGAQKF